MGLTFVVVLIIFAVLLLYGVSIYNQLVSLRNRYQNGFAQIEVQLKRRYDLIPNLVETARAYMSHERETLESVIAARNAAAQGLQSAAASPGDAAAMQVLQGQESALAGALSRFNVVMEAYPDLKASQNMMQLNEELSSTENKVAFARQAYNDQVMTYNTYRQSFPTVVLAGLFGHGSDASLLEFADSDQIQSAPKISF